MCGIVAYVGRKIAQPVLIEGLKRLEYRGYDSAGVAVIDSRGDLHIRKAVGRISVLESAITANARKGSALSISVGSDDYMVTTDASDYAEHTKKLPYSNGHAMPMRKPEGFQTWTMESM